MRTALFRAGIAVIGVFALAALGCRTISKQGEDTADKECRPAGGAGYVCGPTAGATAHMARMLHEAGISSAGAGIQAVERYERSGEETMDRRRVKEAEERCLAAYFGYIPSDDEMDLFYRTVQAECGNTEPEDGIGAVADVIANRCRSDIFPDTLTEVITQKNQFATWDNGAIAEAVPQPWVYEICDDHISEGAVYEDIYYFTAGGYNRYCEPAFVIGNHYFGR